MDKHHGRLDRLKAELKAFSESEKSNWGGIDDLLLAKYIAGETKADETERVEVAAKKFPAVRTAIEVVRGAMAETEGDPKTRFRRGKPESHER